MRGRERGLPSGAPLLDEPLRRTQAQLRHALKEVPHMSYRLHRGDALTVLKALPDESVNAVITAPPYNSGGRTSSDRTAHTARAK